MNQPVNLNAVQRQRRGPRWANPPQDNARPGFRPGYAHEPAVPRPPGLRLGERYGNGVMIIGTNNPYARIERLGNSIVAFGISAQEAARAFESVFSTDGGFTWTHDWPTPLEDITARDEANGRAKALFLSLLTEEQQDEYKRDGYIEITGSLGGTYLVNQSVTQLCTANGIPWQSYCLTARDPGLPTYDNLLARMLLLQTDEAAFLAQANRLPY